MNSKKMRAQSKKELNKTLAKRDEINEQREAVSEELERVSTTLSNAQSILDEIDSEFERKTRLKKKDVALLFTAVALQVIRQYVLTNGNYMDRTNDKDAAKKVKGKVGNSNNPLYQMYGKAVNKYSDAAAKHTRGNGYYKTTITEIVSRPVPFDTQTNAGYEKFNMKITGKKRGLGGGNHRYTTLGHDPILGLIFGTANIATRTATVSTLKSYHIKYGLPSNLNSKGKMFKRNSDYFSENADTRKVLKYGLIEPLESKDPDKIALLGCALLKEIIHLKSDIKSSKSLAIPFTTLNPEMAKDLAKYKVDMDNVMTVTKQVTLAVAINGLVSMIHRMMFVEGKEHDGTLEMYKVRTKKIVMYSNLIASASNVIAVAVMAHMKPDASAINKLDIGGIMVTIASLFHEVKFVSKVKKEFLRSNWEQQVMGAEFSVDKI